VEAIGVCSVEATRIAAELSAEAGVRVARTALKVRNPANAPDANARAALEDFQRQLRAGLLSPPERFDSAADGSARYLRAIITQPLCTVCHGPDVTADVKMAIMQRYPSDEATGFEVGDLRGAFVVEWPAHEASPPEAELRAAATAVAPASAGLP
jgi:hypothetical protein